MMKICAGFYDLMRRNPASTLSFSPYFPVLFNGGERLSFILSAVTGLSSLLSMF